MGIGKKKDRKTVQGQHYMKRTIEPINVIEEYSLNFNLGNTQKYLLRAEYKGTKQEDLKKAFNYLHRELFGCWVDESYFEKMEEKLNK